ncbi:hypothetical protein CHS0354_022152 [Potamilus streckersoni]|uniref:Oxysterol-binding protein n=1 Tax=Potamilus streckersoni TaxID=2493646 RepID=A0AAE0RT43_9BIVA|nr:hypothetical protein CHS0354_022152 [Potamilus streckersoni]
MEGPLSKWTNVVKGWQYRWFVLDENTGLLSYYTSKDKMKKGARRGCVRLKGAIIGIDDEDDSTFTITVDHKTFHFQARDADEREKWIEMLENTIERHSSKGKIITKRVKLHGVKDVPTAADFDRKLAETDAYLQLLIDQVENLERRIEACEDMASKEKYNVIKVTANAMIEAIKHSIVMLQISKESLKEPVMNGSMHEPILTHEADFDYFCVAPSKREELQHVDYIMEAGDGDVRVSGPCKADQSGNNVDLAFAGNTEVQDYFETHTESATVPATSYSSSEDEYFFDAEEEEYKSPAQSPTKYLTVEEHQKSLQAGSSTLATPVIAHDDGYYDELYDEPDLEDLGSLEKHGSIITHLLSQVRIGMDLTKVVLPTFILERRSLLEMYADFFSHPDLFVKISDMKTPRDRMVQVVRWYLSMFHAGKSSEVAKKPYNPILGETFQCFYNVPGRPSSPEKVEDGPIPWGTKENLSFISEQVSHHPPISAFYAEHFNSRLSLDGYIWTKSKFLGLSIGVHMIGQAVLSVIDHDEEYILTFPNGYGRSILTIPWIEMGGKVTISCVKTGYSATIEFLTKPFYGGKKHRITGNIMAPSEKKPFCTIEGEWNGVMWAKYDTGMNEVFVDTCKIPVVKKKVKLSDSQTEFESRRLWRDVTYNLKIKDVEKATDFKHQLEHRQREEAKERKERGLKFETKYFHEVGEHWVYDRPLMKRLGKTNSSTPPGTM